MTKGGRRAVWSCKFEHQESWDVCIFDSNAVSSHWRLLCPGILTDSFLFKFQKLPGGLTESYFAGAAHTKIYAVVEVLIFHVLRVQASVESAI